METNLIISKKIIRYGVQAFRPVHHSLRPRIKRTDVTEKRAIERLKDSHAGSTLTTLMYRKLTETEDEQ